MDHQTSEIEKITLPYILHSNPFVNLSRLISSKKTFRAEKVSLSCASLLLAGLTAKFNTKIFIVADSKKIAENLYHQLLSFLGEKVYLLADREGRIAAVPGFENSVLNYFEEGISALSTSDSGLFIADSITFKKCWAANSPGLKNHLYLRPGDPFDLSQMSGHLLEWGYDLCDAVIEQRTYSQRGGIIDIFPLHSNIPLRIDLFGSTIESLRLFNPVSQRSIKEIRSYIIYPPGEVVLESLTLETFVNRLKINKFYFNPTDDRLFCLSNASIIDKATEIDFQCSTFGLPEEIEKFDYKYGSGNLHVFLFNPDVGSSKQKLPEKIKGTAVINAGLIDEFLSPSLNLACLKSINSSSTLNVPKNVPRYRKQTREKSFIENLSWNDVLVHKHYGVGRYRGLKTITKNGVKQDCINIEYSCGSEVRVPALNLDLLYTGKNSINSEISVNRLNSRTWPRTIKGAKSNAEAYAKELLNLYELRNTKKNHSYIKDLELLEAVSESFPFYETKDQLSALQEIYADMDTARPMNRLLIGDVGFGKTEVALRASMKAVSSGNQVVILTPTTLLADQHFMVLSSRLERFGVRVSLLSRFLPKNKRLNTIKRFKEGSVDILIGTHAVLNTDIVTDRLSLLIIDEEHRFGVKHKDHILSIYPQLDLLTLSATPIPRTLQQTLSGTLNFSTLTTPPTKRLPINTSVIYFDWTIVARAIEKEVARGGTIYFIQNDIEKLESLYKIARDNFPGLNIKPVHGKMSSKNLEKTFLEFYHGKINVLCATTIVESGLDIPNANTIIVCDSHKLGLSQLHQLRGRVGRSVKQAYCLLTVPKKPALSESAKGRLKTVVQNQNLGGGFAIAHEDLQYRGAGNILGYKQSGNTGSVGYHLFADLLDETIKEKQRRTSETLPTVTVNATMIIPSNYVPLSGDRIYFYSKLSNVKTKSGLNDIKVELIDRFGAYPPETKRLLLAAEIRLSLIGSGIDSVGVNGDEVIFSKKPELTSNLKNQINQFYNQIGSVQIKPCGNNGQTSSLTVIGMSDVDKSLSVLNNIAPKFNSK